MEGNELNKALEHDQAQKAALPAALREMTQTQVSIVTIERQLDEKLAVLSKTVALGFLDVARNCQALGLAMTDQKVVKGPDGQQQIDGKPPRPEVAEKWMNIAAIAVDLARQTDVIGDRPIARREPSKE